jgi:hypothetical protein
MLCQPDGQVQEWPSCDLSDRLLEEDFGHHALVLMAQKMAVKQRYASDDRIRQVHHQINISFNRDITVSSHSERLSRTPFWAYEEVT